MSAVIRKIIDNCRAYEGSMLWAYATAKGDFGANTHKCNQFNWDMIRLAKPATLPRIGVTFLGIVVYYRPPTAGEWASTSAVIPGWSVVDAPQPGDVIAEAHDYSDATGHCGIVVRERQTASASSLKGGRIVINDWGFRSDSAPTFRRYTGS